MILDVVAFSTGLEDGQKIPMAAKGISVTVSIQRGYVFIVAPSGVRAQVVTPERQIQRLKVILSCHTPPANLWGGHSTGKASIVKSKIHTFE